MSRRGDYEIRPYRFISRESKGQMTGELNALMAWVVVFMDLVDFDPKQIESPLP
jgi:hypothetical protein